MEWLFDEGGTLDELDSGLEGYEELSSVQRVLEHEFRLAVLRIFPELEHGIEFGNESDAFLTEVFGLCLFEILRHWLRRLFDEGIDVFDGILDEVERISAVVVGVGMRIVCGVESVGDDIELVVGEVVSGRDDRHEMHYLRVVVVYVLVIVEGGGGNVDELFCDYCHFWRVVKD